MEDLFAAEQKIFEEAQIFAKALREGAGLDIDEIDKIVKEYGRLLRQLRRATRISDRATGTLSTRIQTCGLSITSPASTAPLCCFMPYRQSAKVS